MPDSERLVRGTVTQSHDENLRELQVNLQNDEVRDNLEHAEPYGFSSEPYLDGATDAFAGFFDDSREHGIVLCVSDRRYRVKQMQKGEVVLYDDLGRKVYLKREGLLVDGASSPVTVTTSSTVTINASEVVINGNVKVNGTLQATGNITSGSISVQGHVHGGVQSGGSTTSGPQS